MQHTQQRCPYDGRSDRAREVIVAECRSIAEVADPTDSQVRIAEKLGMSRRVVELRIERMERELGLLPADRTEAAQHRRAGAIARRWRRHAL
jgi:hypothetical protein